MDYDFILVFDPPGSRFRADTLVGQSLELNGEVVCQTVLRAGLLRFVC